MNGSVINSSNERRTVFSRRKSIFTIGLVALTLLLSACVTRVVKETVIVERVVTATPATSEVGKGVIATPALPEAVKIGVCTVAWSAPSQEMMAQLIEMFNEEHKGRIEAEYIQGDWGEGDNYVAAGVAAGDGIADVVEWWTGGAKEWYGRDLVYDLRPCMTDEIWETMPDGQWAARMSEGAVFMSGTCGGPNAALYYNPALLEAAGIPTPAPEHPWTWEEFDQYSRMLTVDNQGNNLSADAASFDHENVVQWGFLPRLDTEKLWEEASNFALQASGEYMIRKGETGKWDVFFDDEAIPALRAFYGVVAEGVAPQESIGLTGSSQDELFAQGRAALVLRGFFNVMVLRSRYPEFEFGVMPIPQSDGAKSYWTTIGQGFVVPKCSVHPAEAAEFVFWFQQARPQALWANALYIPPVNPKALAEPALVNNPDWDLIRYYYSVGEGIALDYCVNEPEFIATLYSPTMMEVVQGTKTLGRAIEEIEAAASDILNQ